MAAAKAAQPTGPTQPTQQPPSPAPGTCEAQKSVIKDFNITSGVRLSSIIKALFELYQSKDKIVGITRPVINNLLNQKVPTLNQTYKYVYTTYKTATQKTNASGSRLVETNPRNPLVSMFDNVIKEAKSFNNWGDCNAVIIMEAKVKGVIKIQAHVQEDFENIKGVGRIFIKMRPGIDNTGDEIIRKDPDSESVQFDSQICNPIIGKSNISSKPFFAGIFSKVFPPTWTSNEVETVGTTTYSPGQEIPYNNEATYNHSVKSVVESIKNNPFDLSIVAYGQSGSGKTYTLLGEKGGEKGLLHYSLNQLVNEVPGIQISLSAVQLYQGRAYNALGAPEPGQKNIITDMDDSDLQTFLSKNPDVNQSSVIQVDGANSGDEQIKLWNLASEKFKYLEPSQSNKLLPSLFIEPGEGSPAPGPNNKVVYSGSAELGKFFTAKKTGDEPTFNRKVAQSVTKSTIDSISKDVTSEINNISSYLVQNVLSNRPTRATKMNPESSRSHLFLIFKLKFPDGSTRKITFVDLAGNEVFWNVPKELNGYLPPGLPEKDRIKNDKSVLWTNTETSKEGKFVGESLGHLRKTITAFGKKGVDKTYIPSEIVGKNVRQNQIVSMFIGKKGDSYYATDQSHSVAMYNVLSYVIDLFEENKKSLSKVAMFLMSHTYLPQLDGEEITKEKATMICNTTSNTIKFGAELGTAGIQFGDKFAFNNSVATKAAADKALAAQQNSQRLAAKQRLAQERLVVADAVTKRQLLTDYDREIRKQIASISSVINKTKATTNWSVAYSAFDLDVPNDSVGNDKFKKALDDLVSPEFKVLPTRYNFGLIRRRSFRQTRKVKSRRKRERSHRRVKRTSYSKAVRPRKRNSLRIRQRSTRRKPKVLQMGKKMARRRSQTPKRLGRRRSQRSTRKARKSNTLVRARRRSKVIKI